MHLASILAVLKRYGAFALGFACLGLVFVPLGTPRAEEPGKKEEQPLPERGVVIEIDSPEKALFKIAVPNVRGSEPLGSQAAEVLRSDFRLASLFRVLDARSFIANLDAEGMGMVASAWTAVGAQGVVK